MVNLQLARVMLWDQLVGALAYDPQNGIATFEYAPAWRDKGIEISPLHMPLGGRKYQFPTLAQATYRGLPAVFTDSLPDDFGNAVINAWLARQGRDSAGFSALERLLYTGTRGIGALEYLPDNHPQDHPDQAIELESLLFMAQRVLDQRAGLIEDIDGNARTQGLSALLQVGTSAGGARAKAVIGINRERTEIRSGQQPLPQGFEHYLIKFDGITEHQRQQQTFGDPQGYGRMEYGYYLMAQACGIDMNPSELLEENGRAHFMTQRFDRQGNDKLHFQSLCALDHADYKQPGHYSYEQLFSVMRQLRLDREQALQMYRRMIFNIIARNQDDHSKNIGFLMTPDGKWRLSPAFDLAYSYRPGSPWVSQHQLSLNGKRDDFARHDLLSLATSFRREAENIIDEIQERVAAWPIFARQAGVERQFMQEIQRHHRLCF